MEIKLNQKEELARRDVVLQKKEEKVQSEQFRLIMGYNSLADDCMLSLEIEEQGWNESVIEFDQYMGDDSAADEDIFFSEK